jgi:hypothetical protein
MGLEVLDQCFCLFRCVLFHLADFLLEVQSASIVLLAQQALLHIIPHQESLDLVLVELAASAGRLLVEVLPISFLYDQRSVKRDGLLNNNKRYDIELDGLGD